MTRSLRTSQVCRCSKGRYAKWQQVAIKTARIQADRSDHREALQWDRQQAEQQAQAQEEFAHRQAQREEQRTQALRTRREEFLGLVLTAQERLFDRVAAKSRGEVSQVPSAETASAFSRKAYALALLYLDDDLRRLARDFYRVTVDVDLVIERHQAERVDDVVAAWRPAYDAIEAYFWQSGGERSFGPSLVVP